MTYGTIDHGTFTELASAGKIQVAEVQARVGGWAITVKFNRQQKELIAEHSRKPRLFRKFETLVGYLKDAGIAHFKVNAEEFGEATKTTTRPRPDKSETLRETHRAAAEYDREFRARVQKSLDDPRPNLSSEEVTAQFLARRADLEKMLEDEKRLGIERRLKFEEELAGEA